MKLTHSCFALAAMMMLASAARADDVDLAALTAPVQRLVGAINHGDTSIPPHIFTKDAIVIDDFAPHRWSGKANAASWYGDLVGTTPQTRADFAAMKAVLSVETAQFARVTGDDAYLVEPALFIFTDQGKRIRQTGQWVMSLRRVKGEWLISGHAYAITGETEIPPN